MWTGSSRDFWGDFVFVFSPIGNDPQKTQKQIFTTHPDPGQYHKFVYVYVFFLSPELLIHNSALGKWARDGLTGL